MIYYPYIDPTNYTDFINDDAKTSTKKWAIKNASPITIFTILFITLIYLIKFKKHLPLLVYSAILAIYFLVFKKL
jgi:hypothetical protein